MWVVKLGVDGEGRIIVGEVRVDRLFEVFVCLMLMVMVMGLFVRVFGLGFKMFVVVMGVFRGEFVVEVMVMVMGLFVEGVRL